MWSYVDSIWFFYLLLIWFYVLFISFCMIFYVILIILIIMIIIIIIIVINIIIILLEVWPTFSNDPFFTINVWPGFEPLAGHSNVRPESPTTTDIFQWPALFWILTVGSNFSSLCKSFFDDQILKSNTKIMIFDPICQMEHP